MSKILKTGLTAVLMTTAVATAHAEANWVDDWFDAAVTTQPGVFESQQRTYATLGSFNGRLKTHTDSLLTISKPHINVGCGGIDIFMGGFSFLNPDYLVEKAEKMIRVAPYVAFDMALNELSTTVATIKDRAENIINALNSLQMDECKSAKALVVSAKQWASGNSDAALDTISSGLIQGADSLWKEAKQGFTDDPGGKVKSSINSSSMSSAGKSELLKEGSLLNSIGAKMGITTTRIAQMRALIGDIDISYSGEYRFTPIGNCAEATYDALIDKTPYKKGAGTSASCTQTGGNTIQEYVNTNIDGIAQKIMNDKTSPYTNTEKDYIGKAVIPVVYILNTASKYGETQLQEASEEIKPIAAKAYAFYMFIEMVRNVTDAAKKYEEYLATCTGDEFTTSHREAIKTLLERAKEVRSEAFEHYQASIGDMNHLYDVLDTYKQQQNEIDSIINDSKYAMGRVF
ncbi:conjugal transfer protein TraH [Seleniivibrio woodruffii]|uniref:Conjugative transfer pilus assembly protein TraH n=1 Tax=Seleniivibrio woodruffii TaxID=1078050 RepID=A0A4R1K3Z9_9BACT|nr:conjugal transfer protein TraH [Seleniivibrio woodruffii]TCK58433.1 conjugative transfer pilus assembly protein TraH [Seleniivibrio woodruffii]TVZ36806.1 conjugative transfer pilus assembly protein TraH [Seleniivibrio woodruffii]